MGLREYSFSAMPAEWIRRGDLKQFRGGGCLGNSITALKLYITVLSAVRADDSGLGPGQARLTYSQLEDATDAARSMISPAIEFLHPWIATRRDPGGNIYEVVGFTTEPGAWVRLPAEYISTRRPLRGLPARGQTTLAALKMYLYLLERIERRTTYARVSYPRIRETAGVAQNDIPRAITALGAIDLIRTASTKQPTENDSQRQNIYFVLGLGSKNVVPPTEPILAMPPKGTISPGGDRGRPPWQNT